MAQPSLITFFRRNPRSGTEASQMAMLTSLLKGICLPNMLDRWCWSFSGDEEFSVSSARILIDDKTLGTSSALFQAEVAYGRRFLHHLVVGLELP
ncbi:hypothetical protein Tco_0916977 [Tanacetum coccineum]